MASSEHGDLSEGFVSPYVLLDPRQIYDDRAILLARKAKGVEHFVYQLFGPHVIASIAFAINPLSRFAKDDEVYTLPTLRTRKTANYPITRAWHRLDRNLTRANYIQPGGSYGPLTGNWVDVLNSSGSLQQGTCIDNYTIDTTNKSRPSYQKGGPLKLFKSEHSRSGCTAYKRAYSINTFPDGQASDSLTHRKYDQKGPFALYTKASQQLVHDREVDFADRMITKYLPTILSRALPASPNGTLFRSLAELKDVRMGSGIIASIHNAPEVLRRRYEVLRDLPGHYLEGQFAIAPLVRDTLQLLDLPAKVAKKMNFLLKRSGQPTTYRSGFVLPQPDYSVPSFSDIDYTSMYDKFRLSGPELRHESKLRLTLNATFSFPLVDVPAQRYDSEGNSSLKQHLYGATPSITDIYRLMPWTWLVDWFTGFGSYLDAIERINSDPSLMNYGYISYISNGTISQRREYQVTDLLDEQYRPSPNFHQSSLRKGSDVCTWSYHYHKRDILTDHGLKSPGRPSTLDAFQASILTALVGQAAFGRKLDFPRPVYIDV